jgi:hypothetical protein
VTQTVTANNGLRATRDDSCKVIGTSVLGNNDDRPKVIDSESNDDNSEDVGPSSAAMILFQF